MHSPFPSSEPDPYSLTPAPVPTHAPPTRTLFVFAHFDGLSAVPGRAFLAKQRRFMGPASKWQTNKVAPFSLCHSSLPSPLPFHPNTSYKYFPNELKANSSSITSSPRARTLSSSPMLYGVHSLCMAVNVISLQRSANYSINNAP